MFQWDSFFLIQNKTWMMFKIISTKLTRSIEKNQKDQIKDKSVGRQNRDDIGKKIFLIKFYSVQIKKDQINRK